MSARPARRLADGLVTTWAVAGCLIAAVFAVAPLERAVRAAPWLMGPGLWVLTAAGSGALLQAGAGWRLGGRELAAATVIGGVADGLVVAAGHPWPGLVTGTVAFSAAAAAMGRPPDRERHPGPAAAAVSRGPGPGR
ncbi:MAG: hypothetical protein AB7V42_08190 [Thermoleophilia bacterium]